MGPASILTANILLDDWVREKVVNIVENAVALYGFGVFLVSILMKIFEHFFFFR